MARRHQANHDLGLASFLVPVVPKGRECIALPLKVRGGHIIEYHRRGLPRLPPCDAIQRILNLCLARGQRIQGGLEVLFVEVPQPQGLRHRVIGSPPHS